MAGNLSPKLDWSLAGPLWSQTINPFLSNPLNQGSILENISLVTGANVISHKLGHEMNGWFLVDIQGIATIYRSAPLNSLTLTLTASAPVLVSIGVF
jgi:hypothetical protein